MRLAPALLVALALAVVACSADPPPGYRAASAEERDALLRVVREYYDVFDRGQVTGDISPLYALHPRLAEGEDRRRGVNTESWTVERARTLGAREVVVDVDSYEPARAYVKGDSAVVYVHGLFTWTYPNGSQTKGELPVRFDLDQQGGRWTIVRTDERVLGETPEPTPR
ncbi:MAG TPA: hypothetical protein VFC31_15050 [Candidatus Limnocylindria bacterium]|nr:hypothetical protein [Candidatus Limnocylindria bacterium]